ncbi:flavin reductase family protein [Amycolatopsis rhabdoformis]|uniref:Flavin reductase family protein n=1 Tax=Amycolatopsis rhabdoformis TaxID=1448059 RepID=A0ABZ1HX78_9PSEU|nr:flavin reductase family protein [Amycolatopsis rhabdoformis]WSE26193.1 flavin reductase family protein [Amycolatopsis rhabdoformis]
MWDEEIVGCPPEAVTARELRTALGKFTSGVCVITTLSDDGKREGITVNSFASVSLNPAMVLWSIARGAPSSATFTTAPRFGVNVLSARQKDLSTRFSRPAADKFAGLDGVTTGLGAVPMLDGAVAQFECRNQFQRYGGDHLIIVGTVDLVRTWDRPPLVFFAGQYADLDPRHLPQETR